MKDQRQPLEFDPSVQELRQTLQTAWGIDFRRLTTLICRLATDTWHSVSDLVAISSLSHRAVTDLLKTLDSWLEKEDQKARLRPDIAPSFAALFACQEHHPVPADPWEPAAGAHPLLASMTRILEAAPRSDLHLDHVSATPLTCAKRALFLAGRYDLSAAEILFLGDHDLTSVALAHIYPDLPIAVVDVDERILDYIGTLATEYGWNIRTTFADLRVELPRSLEERFDLVFTDPPYTPTGIRLFLGRGIAALKEARYARLLLSYGFGENQPGLGFKTQTVLHELRLVSEAILPDFNRYTGAEAIGSASELYILRPTRRTRAAAASIESTPGIYTQGRTAVEAQSEALPTFTRETIEQHLLASETDDLTLVGTGWPPETAGRATTASLGGFLRTMYLGQGKPPFTRQPHSGVVAVNLHPHYGSYLLRLLLTAAAQRLIVCAPDRDLHRLFLAEKDDSLPPLLKSVYQLAELVRGHGQHPGIAVLERLPNPESPPLHFILRYIADRRRAKLGNAWREALVSWSSRDDGTRLTKNQARDQIRQSGFPATQLQNFLSELPAGDLRALVAAVPRTLAAAPPPSASKPDEE